MVYLHLLGQREHHEKCKPARCVRACDVAGFLAVLEEPLFDGEIRYARGLRERQEALRRGEIPQAG